MTERNLYQNEHVMKILQAVNDNPNIMKTEIIDVVREYGSKDTTQSKTATLIEEGLIEEKKHGKHNKKTYTLTDKGQTVLVAMLTLQNITEGRDADDFEAPEEMR